MVLLDISRIAPGNLPVSSGIHKVLMSYAILVILPLPDEIQYCTLADFSLLLLMAVPLILFPLFLWRK